MKYFLWLFSLLLLQEEQWSVSARRMCIVLVNHLRGLSLSRKSVVRQTDGLERHYLNGLTGL